MLLVTLLKFSCVQTESEIKVLFLGEVTVLFDKMVPVEQSPLDMMIITMLAQTGVFGIMKMKYMIQKEDTLDRERLGLRKCNP
jgi:hypothetical protein